MKQLLSIFLLAISVLSIPSLAAHAQMTMPKAKASAKPLNVAFLIYPEVEPLDLSGPIDVFVKANTIAPHSYNVYTVAVQSQTVASESGVLTLTSRYTLQNSPHPDIIVIPGAPQQQVEHTGSDPRLIRWLQNNHAPSQTVMSVCTGAFILGRARLLDNRNSTTHWLCQSTLQRQFPKTKTFSGIRFIRDGNILSTAGVSSGIDGALQLVEQTSGKPTADMVARAIQYRRNTATFPDQPHERVHIQPISPPARVPQKLALNYDPVCHMKVNTSTKNTFTYQGKTYGFCSPGCRDTFAAHPTQFMTSPPE